MGADTIGAYIVLLDLIYARGGPVVEDARHLGGVLGCSTRLSAAMIQRLVDRGKIVRIDGRLTNPKAEDEIRKAAEITRNQTEAGAKGGRNSANARRNSANDDRDEPENGVDIKDNIDLDQASLNLTRALDNNREDKSRDVVVVDARTPARAIVAVAEPPAEAFDLVRFTDEVCRAGGVRNIDPGRIAGHAEIVRQWQQAGADPPLILEAVGVAVATAAEPINSLKYFDSRIRQAVAIREGKANGHAPRQNRPGSGGDGFAIGLERAVAAVGVRRMGG